MLLYIVNLTNQKKKPMRVKNALIAAIVPLVTLLPQLTPIATAQVRSSCNVPIVGRERGSQVNMRSGAGTNYESPSYVLVGQLVNLLRDDRDGDRLQRKDNEGMIWAFVEYLPTRTRGWIREDFLGEACVR